MDKDFDIFAITETELNLRDYDHFVIGSLIPNGYRFVHSARERRGGGVGLLFKSSQDVKQISVHGVFGCLPWKLRLKLTR